MFFDDILLCKSMIEKYGLQRPMLDAGGIDHPVVADYSITLRTGIQESRYLHFQDRVFDFIDPEYVILNPEKGDVPIEEMRDENVYGTILCLSVLEHTVNPFDVFSGFARLLKPGGLLILSTEFSFPFHPSPIDFWRMSPDCLRMLAIHAGLNVLEAGWRLEIFGDAGIRDINTGAAREIRTVFIAASRGELGQGEHKQYVIPTQI